MALPLVQLPAEPPQPDKEASDEDQIHLDVPAEPTMAPLQPAKMAVWRMFMEQVISCRSSGSGYYAECHHLRSLDPTICENIHRDVIEQPCPVG